jgi:hypothetical protein
MAFKQVMEMRKNGNQSEAYELALNDYRQFPEDIWTKRAFSWCLFDALKANASYAQKDVFVSKLFEVRELEIPSDETMFWNNIVWPISAFVRDCSGKAHWDELTTLLDAVKNFPFVKPGKEYSVLFNAFLTGKEEWAGFVAFCDWWGFDNFRDEDYECEVLPNGKKMPISLVESAYIAYAKGLLHNRDKDAILAFIPKLQELAEQNPKMQYPNYYVGKLLLATDSDKQEAVKTLLPFVRKKQSDFWVWQLFAEALEDDEEKYMACLLRAVHCNTPEQYIVRVYLIIANAFKQLQYYADARFYLDKYCHIKAETQAKISNAAYSMLHETWYAEAAGQNPAYELDYMSITNELLFADTPETDAVVSFINKDKKMVTVVYGKEKEGFFKFDRFVKKLYTGDSVKIRIQEVSADGFMKVLSARVSDAPVISDYCKSVTGSVSSNKSMTAFFLQYGSEAFFIPPAISSKMHLVVGEPISAIVLYSYNKKREEWKWSCVKINR